MKKNKSLFVILFIFLFITKANSQFHRPEELKLNSIKYEYELIFYIDMLDYITNDQVQEDSLHIIYYTPIMISNLYENDQAGCLKILKKVRKEYLDELKCCFEKFKEIQSLKNTYTQKKSDFPNLEIWSDYANARC